MQERANKLSLDSDRSTYWTQHADQVSWYKNTCYNCVDRHVERGNGDRPAIFWHSEVAQQREVYSYQRLKDEVETLAGVLRELGVQKGDSVVVYSKFRYPRAI